MLSGATVENAGAYACVATNAVGATTSNVAILTLTATTNPGHLINLSTLSNIQGSLSMGFSDAIGISG